MSKKLCLLCMMGVFVYGCLPVRSIHPFFTKHHMVTNPTLVGVWGDNDSDNWTFTPGEDSSYTLYIKDANVVSCFKTYLFKVNQTFFLDVVPDSVFKQCDKDNLELSHVLPLHGILKIEITDTHLILYITDEDKWESHLKSDPNAVDYTLVEDTVILTDNSEALLSFLNTIKNKNDLWDEPVTLNRLSVGDPNDMEHVHSRNIIESRCHSFIKTFIEKTIGPVHHLSVKMN